METPQDALVRVRRPDGKETVLRVPREHLERVKALAEGDPPDLSILSTKVPPG